MRLAFSQAGKSGIVVVLFAFTVLRPVRGDDTPITALPLYTEGDGDVRGCITSVSSTFSTRYGCPNLNPASCLCIDATSSFVVASNLRACVVYGDATSSQATTATELWASYCSINAGVSAKDETLLEDLPLWAEFTSGHGCATIMSSSASISWGCDIVTPAVCLCANITSSAAVASSMLSCVSGEGIPSSQQSSIALLWAAYCSVNLESPATRSAPNSVAATTTTPSGDSPTSGTSSSGSSRSSGSKSNSTALKAALGVVAAIALLLLIVIGVSIWWCRKTDSNKRDSKKLWSGFWKQFKRSEDHPADTNSNVSNTQSRLKARLGFLMRQPAQPAANLSERDPVALESLDLNVVSERG